MLFYNVFRGNCGLNFEIIAEKLRKLAQNSHVYADLFSQNMAFICGNIYIVQAGSRVIFLP